MKIIIDDSALYIDTIFDNYHFLNERLLYNFISDLLTEKQFIKYITEDTARIFIVSDNKFKNLINELIENNSVVIM